MTEQTADHVPATRFTSTPNLEMRFPPLSRTMSEVTGLLSDQPDQPDIHRLVDIVNMDPVIAAAVLRRINSAYYGLRRRIGDIRKAVYLLGFLEVCNLILTTGIMRLNDVVRSGEQEVIFRQIMRLSLGAASYAQALALHLRLPQKQTAFTIGLLHGTGRLVLLYNKPDDYEALWWTTDVGAAPSVEAERTIFGTDHAELGGLAAQRWNLPLEIEVAIRTYLAPNGAAESDHRLLAQALAAGVSATEQLHMTASTGGTFHPPGALVALSDAMQVPTSELVNLIRDLQPQTARFIEEMISE